MRIAVLILRSAVVAALVMVAIALAILPRASSRETAAEATAASSDDGSADKPDAMADRNRRLAEKGMRAGSPVLIRIFKAEFELELWLRKDDRFELFATYPICYWSGILGPKTHEGDRQAPEGFYDVGLNQIHRHGRWPRSLNIGYPNALDRAYARTGSLILVHGGCTSIGCFAMTNPLMEEIYSLVEQALQEGQPRVSVHVFPFRMTEANLAAHAHDEWSSFWQSLKPAYDLFESTRLPPRIGVCNKQYIVGAGDVSGASGPPILAPAPCAESEGGGAVPVLSAEAEADATDKEPAAKVRKVAAKSRHRSAARKIAARRARTAVHARHPRPAPDQGALLEAHAPFIVSQRSPSSGF
jgi:murein L,D-transpeptidase YafK